MPRTENRADDGGRAGEAVRMARHERWAPMAGDRRTQYLRKLAETEAAERADLERSLIKWQRKRLQLNERRHKAEQKALGEDVRRWIERQEKAS